MDLVALLNLGQRNVERALDRPKDAPDEKPREQVPERRDRDPSAQAAAKGSTTRTH